MGPKFGSGIGPKQLPSLRRPYGETTRSISKALPRGPRAQPATTAGETDQASKKILQREDTTFGLILASGRFQILPVVTVI